ncbi:UDP-glycosyltransferase 85A7 [Acorus calamus]|uniref:UDP-glycosyltransferase 85A7 n=1 Tax=Acorus calamus TaxID=4465 RepID=A0AAV9DVY3_ACOCL|nr:UDP-glycosyltransferase 85A7 [Acorus calamus]
MPDALKMSQAELIDHAGLDSAVYLRIYIVGNLSFLSKDLVVSNIDKLSISNVIPHSEKWILNRLWVKFLHSPIIMPFKVTSWGKKEVVVRNIPPAPGHTISETVDQFFQTNHPDHYIGHQAVHNANKFAKLVKQRERVQNWLDYDQLKSERRPDKRPTRKKGFIGLFGERVDSIDFYQQSLIELDKRIASEHQKIIKDGKAIMPVAFVTFDSRWGAAVCAQTQQTKNPTHWLTDWAPEPHDVYWKNLAIPFVYLSIRRLIISVSVFALVFFYMIPIAFVQSLANLEGLEKVFPFLRPLIEWKVIKSFLQGFLPGLALKVFLYILPTVLMVMSKVEGYLSRSSLERRTAAKYYYFMLVNVFLGSIITGTAFEQLHSFLYQAPTQVPRTIGVSIPMKATFFITYIMVDGWAGVASEILRLKPLVIYHLKNMFIVKTERDREKAMRPESIALPVNLPKLQLYFLLGLVYAVVTPVILPFILVFFAFAFLVYRHQIINVYHQKYESAGAFWPHVHRRIIASLLISQLLLLGLLSTKKASNSTTVLIVLPVLTIWFHKYCKSRFEPAFRKYPLEEAMAKDKLERASEPNLNVKAYLSDAYLHPIFWSFKDDVEMGELFRGEKKLKLVVKLDQTSRRRRSSPSSEESEEERGTDGRDRRGRRNKKRRIDDEEDVMMITWQKVTAVMRMRGRMSSDPTTRRPLTEEDCMRRHCPASLRELLVREEDEGVVPPATCIVSDGVMSFTLDVAEELQLPQKNSAKPV